MTRSLVFQNSLVLVLLGLGGLAACAPLQARSWRLAGTTAQLATATCALALPLGTLVAAVLVRTAFPGRRAAIVLLAWLLFIPLYLQVGAWQAGFGLQGWQTLAGWGPAWLDGFWGAVWVHVAAAIPWVALIVAIGLRAVPAQLEEAALLEAAPGDVFFHVTLRHAAPLVVAAALWVVISTAGEIAVTDLFQIRTYAEELYTETALGASPGEAPLRALPGIAMTGWLALGALLVALRLAPRRGEGNQRPPVDFELGAWRWPVAIAVAVLLGLLIGLPLANLAWKSGVLVEQTDAGRQRHWSALKCATVVASSPLRYSREIVASLRTGALAATAALAVSILLAWFARRSRWGALAIIVAIVTGLALPGPIIGLGVIWALNRPDWPWALYLYDRTIVPTAAAQMVRALPLACLIVWYAIDSLPREELEAAELDGAGEETKLFRVMLPQRTSALAVAWLASLAIAVGDMGATILVVPPGVEPLAIRISGLLHYGVEDQVAGISLALAGIFLLVALAVLGLASRSPRAIACQKRG